MAAELWQDEGGSYLFHYTEAEYARAIAENGYYEVGFGAEFGHGLYATDLRPEEADPEAIRDVCFGGDAAENAFSGVIVLLVDDDHMPFKEVDEQVFRGRRDWAI